MDPTTYTALREDALAALADGQLVRAIEALRSLAEMLREGQVYARLEELRETYDRLLAFFVEGMPDPDRQRMTARRTSSPMCSTAPNDLPRPIHTMPAFTACSSAWA